MQPFVDLSRRFRDLKKAELEEPELLAYLNEHKSLSTLGWSELLDHPRVLLLAEAGSGKTAEMREQANRLAADKKYAFFIPLESIDQDNLTDLLSAEEERAFATWKTDGHSTAWFFLDAVDELKINQGKFERALSRFAKAVDGLLDRTYVVISCRPTDWRPSLDMTTLKAKLPIVQAKTNAPPPSDEVFLAALRKQQGVQQQEKSPVKVEGVRTVILLPMSTSQIETLSRGLGVKDPAIFIAEIDKQNAWAFARRPLDCSELVAIWKESAQLGTRAEQHETNVRVKLKDDPERSDRGVLSDIRARLGAERLALALALTRTRTIRSPEQTLDIDRAEGVLDPIDVLPDWDEEERQTLLRRALFDPASYGRARFHHRSVQEYLAACRLKKLRDKGMPVKALLRLLFAERYQVAVVIPSMRPIAAWLALWNDDVRRELMAREPETLLSLGDSESLSISARVYIVRAFAVMYGEGGWRGLNIPIDEVRRLAHPELAEVIRDTWGGGPTNTDVRELLLKLIWQGAIEGCVDIAEYAARNIDYSPAHRTIGVRALIACHRDQTAREIVDSILEEPDTWPDNIVHGVVGDLFPKIITDDELIALVERTPEPKNAVGGFSWTLREIATDINPWSDSGVRLRNKLADLIWRGRQDEQEWYRIRGRFDYAVPALALLCDRQLSAGTARRDNDLIRASVIANRFGDDESGAGESLNKLRRHFNETAGLREAAFWIELAIMDDLTSAKDGWNRFYNIHHNSVIGHLTETDRTWLEAALVDKNDRQRRAVALHALVHRWSRRGRIEAEGDFLCKAVRDNTNLAEEAARFTGPVEQSAEIKEMERRNRQQERSQKLREQERLKDWAVWRDELLADPATAFGPQTLGQTISNLYKWLAARGGGGSHVWDQDALAQAFSSNIARRAATAFQTFWRDTPPTLWSNRPPKERSTTPWVWMYGLCGVTTEATSPDWATKLSSKEARIAAAYATVELNGFSSWLGELAAAYPREVDATLGVELTAELDTGPDLQYLPILQDLTYADSEVKQLLAPRCKAALKTWPSVFTNDAAAQFAAHNLDQVLSILHETIENQDRIAIASECNTRFAGDPGGPLAHIWLRGLFRFDSEWGAETFEQGLAALDEPERAERTVAALAALFGKRDAALLNIENPSSRALILGRLVRCAYQYVRREDDQEHEDAYPPDTRDRAEDARDFLLTALLNTPGAEARRVILELATESLFAHIPDRLCLLARQRAASDAEFDAFSASDLMELEEHLEAPPHDRDGLFKVMKDRLDDLSHDIAHDDFTDRRTLRAITDEIEMQRTLAHRLREMARGSYVVIREDEVADRKEPDIRLAAVRGDQKAAIELKIADKRWTLRQLEEALRNQLVGQYLRHENSRAGCLLLTYDGTKDYWKHPETNAHLKFPEVVGYLVDVAKKIEHGSNHRLRITVHGLDLTDPPLTPACK